MVSDVSFLGLVGDDESVLGMKEAVNGWSPPSTPQPCPQPPPHPQSRMRTTTTVLSVFP
ncbi:hypothetical protein JHK82_046513 [Glycine max]|nr:hypothetical protein JHK86_046409 [Glycine max]KAG4932190.1 hypothetical protein JHK87_046192 [Glycine soja]KAG5096659.1 hypothetical protein JHK82_046513 [Glycine max]KAG5101448.1 hypothetical protein JHK84_046417 [Glycine max]KHN03251.1 hypothetical protein glysoja_004277 [Glycine soja]